MTEAGIKKTLGSSLWPQRNTAVSSENPMEKMANYEPDRNQFRLTQEEAAAARKRIDQIVENVEKVVLGKTEVVRLVVLAVLAEGHVLLEDVPGVGKTSLVSAVARSIDCGFQRIQFTPDLMPSDVSGFSIYNQKTGEFEFRPGGVMSNIVLADEINRASAKTQASLLEAMEERQVTVDGHTYPLEKPFMVMATQNPLESFGTYPLPDAQIDRFLIKLSIGYPNLSHEAKVILMSREEKAALTPVIDRDGVCDLIDTAKKVYIAPALETYIAEILNATRTSADVENHRYFADPGIADWLQ